MFLLLACTDTADITVEDPPPCGMGFERGEDGACYEVDTDTADPTDADTDTDSDTDADTDSDTDTDTDTTAEDLDDDGYSAASGDCDDLDPAVHPGAAEACNEVDDDCNGEVDEDLEHAWYRDLDDDGYGDRNDSVSACDAPRGYVGDDSDCDDGDGDIHPDAADDQGDELDNDCDGDIDEDWDPCATPYGWAEWWTTETQYVGGAPGTYNMQLDGSAVLCGVECSSFWVTFDGLTEPYTGCSAPWAAPYTLPSEGVGVCLTVSDPGAYASTTCDAYTSAGTVSLTVTWNE